MSDIKVKELLAKVEEQKSGLGKRPRASWHTNGIFKFGDGGKHFNLNTVVDFSTLVTAMSFLLDTAGTRAEAAERLGVEDAPFKWQGYTIEEWEHDFKLRIEIVNWQKRKKQLEATQAKLKTLFSEAGKTAMELEAIEALLQ